LSEAVVTIRKWGNSLGVTLPNELVEKNKLSPNDKLILELKKIDTWDSLFGTLKTNKTAQQIKDEMRKGWDY
jgi:antitoxin component of MazEF toxin-antitoxin module